jgi:hypothetical protein
MSAFVTEKQTEDTLQLLKSRNFLLSFENKQLRDRVFSLEQSVNELEMRLTKNDQDRNEHGDGSGQNPVPSCSGETQLQWSF